MDLSHTCTEAMPVDFPGREQFIASIDACVTSGDSHAITTALRQALSDLIRDPAIVLPAQLRAAIAEHYARRELYRSPQYGYSLVAMTWGPGPGTPLHDHSGLWCVEGVWLGELDILQYELLERAGDRFRFEAASQVHAGTGSAGSLIPPHEYHTIRNGSTDAIAISLHVYQAPLVSCSRFISQADGWFVRECVAMQTDVCRTSEASTPT